MENSLFSNSGMGISDDEISLEIENKLKNKYGEEFVVRRIGSRFGTLSDDSVTTYCSPKNNNRIVFEAILKDDFETLTDNYYLRKALYKLELHIAYLFNQMGSLTLVKCSLPQKRNLDKEMTLEEFLAKYPDIDIMCHIIARAGTTETTISNVYNLIIKNYNNINLKSLIFEMDDTNFLDAFNELKDVDKLTESKIKQFNVKEEKNIKIENNKIIVNN